MHLMVPDFSQLNMHAYHITFKSKHMLSVQLTYTLVSTLPSLDNCLYSRISGGLLGSKTTYLFSCNSICTYWIFYVLDFPTPPSGAANRTIPFKADTVSLSTQNRLALDQLNAISQGSNVSITAWPGKVRLVAQCVYQMQNPLSSTYHDGVMLRDGKSNRASPIRESVFQV